MHTARSAIRFAIQQVHIVAKATPCVSSRYRIIRLPWEESETSCRCRCDTAHKPSGPLATQNTFLRDAEQEPYLRGGAMNGQAWKPLLQRDQQPARAHRHQWKLDIMALKGALGHALSAISCEKYLHHLPEIVQGRTCGATGRTIVLGVANLWADHSEVILNRSPNRS
jgi:hypothetical protein